MADNETTYTAVVEVEVKGGEDVKELGDDAEGAGGKFKSLRSQIRETTVALQAMADKGGEGTKEFKKLSDTLDKLQDQQKRVAFQSSQIEDKLSALPGPIGAIGKGFASAKSAVETFGVQLAIATGGLTLIIGAIVAMKEALSKTAEGQATLNKVSQAFSSILGPIMAIIEKVAIPVFNKFADILGWVGEKFNQFAKYLGISESKIKEATLSVDKVQQDVNEAEKKRLEEIQKKREEDAKKHEAWLAKKKAADEKAAAEKKKAEEEAQKNLDAANKVQVEAYLATISQRDQEIYKRGQKLNEDILALQKAGYTDLTAVKNAYDLQVAEINKKYDDEALKKKEEEWKKKEEDSNKLQEWYKTQNDKIKTYEQERADAAFAANQAIGQSWVDLANNITNILSSLNTVFEQGSTAQKVFAIASIAINAAGAIGQILLNKAAANAAYNKTIADGNSAILSGTTKLFNPLTAPLGIAEIAAGNAAIGGAVAGKVATKVNSALQIAAVGASAAGQIAAVLSAKKSGGAAAASSGDGGGGQAPTPPPAPAVAGMAAPVIQGTQSASPGTQIANTLAGVTGKPIVAQVVSGQVTSQQALDRRTNQAATFGGY